MTTMPRKRLSDAHRMRRITPSAFAGVYSNCENAFGVSGSLILLPASPVFKRKRAPRMGLSAPLRGPRLLADVARSVAAAAPPPPLPPLVPAPPPVPARSASRRRSAQPPSPTPRTTRGKVSARPRALFQTENIPWASALHALTRPDQSNPHKQEIDRLLRDFTVEGHNPGHTRHFPGYWDSLQQFMDVASEALPKFRAKYPGVPEAEWLNIPQTDLAMQLYQIFKRQFNYEREATKHLRGTRQTRRR